jgi:ketosteroid isomerase-like protein
MSARQVQEFIDALSKLETEQDSAGMLSLFSDDSVLGNVLAPEAFKGRDGAEKFWHDYRSSFGEIKSNFHNRIEASDGAALEWIAQGTSSSGDPVRYEGITVLEFSDTNIKRFHSYFDPRSLGRQFHKSSSDVDGGNSA